MFKNKKEISKKKLLKKTIKKALKPKNIGRFLILLATISLLATSLLPVLSYLF
jgi:hypothetical protein